MRTEWNWKRCIFSDELFGKINKHVLHGHSMASFHFILMFIFSILFNSFCVHINVKVHQNAKKIT